MLISGLNAEQSRAFTRSDAARNLLASSLRVIGSDARTENTRDPIMTMLSSGMEKLYKPTMGLLALDNDGAWASKKQMQDMATRSARCIR